MSQKFTFKQKFFFAEVEETNSKGYYKVILLDAKWNKVVFISDKNYEGLVNGDKVEAEIEITIKSERMFAVVNKKPASEASFVETANKSLKSLKKIEAK